MGRARELERAVLRPYVWNTLAAVFTQGMTFLVALVVSRTLGVHAFGVYSIGQNTILTGGSLLTMGLALTLNAHTARSKLADVNGTQMVVDFGLTVALCSGLLGAVGLFLLAPALATHLYNDTSLVWPLRIAAVTIPCAVVVAVQGGAIAGLESFRGLAVGSALQLGLTVAVALGGAISAGPSGALLALCAGLLVRTLWNQRVIRDGLPARDSQTPQRSARDIWGRIRPFAIPAALSGSTLFPAMWLANSFLVNARGATEYGLFAAALLIKTAITFVPLQMGTVLLAQGVRLRGEGREQDARRYARNALALTSAITLSLAAAVWLAPPDVLLILGPRFVHAAPLLDAMMFVAILEPLAILAVYEAIRQDRMWQCFALYSLPKDAILIGGAFLATPAFGAMGLILAYAASWLYGLLAAASLTGLFDFRRSNSR